jgi:hypothetical protein
MPRRTQTKRHGNWPGDVKFVLHDSHLMPRLRLYVL